jgi:glutathione S-transferase
MEIKELGIPCELIEVSWKRNENVDEMNKLNPLGVTPTLVSDDGKVLSQNTAILEYLGDKFSKGEHIPSVGSWDRAQVTSWLSFVAADFHKAFGPAFRAEDMASSEESQKQIEAFGKKNISDYLAYIESTLKSRNYACGEKFTVADCYLFTVLRWCEWVDISLSEYKSINAYMERMSRRPGIAKALELEDN